MLKAGVQLLKSAFGAGVKGSTTGIAKAWVGAGFTTGSLGEIAWGATKAATVGGGWSKASIAKSGLWGGAKWGSGSALDAMADSEWGQEQSGAARALMHMGAFGFKASAVRSFARGAVGSGLSAAGRMQGDPGKHFRIGSRKPTTGELQGLLGKPYGTADYNKYRAQITTQKHSLYDRMVTHKLGGVFQGGDYSWRGFLGGTGSIYGMAARQGLGLAGGAGKIAARLPAQMIVGAAPAAWAATRVGLKGARLGIGGGAALFGKGAWGRSFIGKGASFSDIVSPQYMGPFKRGFQKAGIIGREGLSPIMAGTIGVAGTATMFGAAMRFNQGIGGNRGLSPVPMKQRHFQGGMRANMRGPFKNYGPALTLAIHNNHSRVMP